MDSNSTKYLWVIALFFEKFSVFKKGKAKFRLLLRNNLLFEAKCAYLTENFLYMILV